MIDGLRPYPETKPTGLPWLGDVPAHWDVRRNGRLFSARRETRFPDLPVLEVSIRSGVESGQPLRLKFAKAIYGPYAENLRHVLACG